MKMCSECDGCAICGWGDGCLAGRGEDLYYKADKEQVISRLTNGIFPRYRDMMIQYLKDEYNYEYIEENKQYEY